MSRPYNVLRGILRENDYTQEMLGAELGLTQCCISQRMNAHTPWDSNEMWQIMKLLHIPAKRFHEVFPPNGVISG